MAPNPAGVYLVCEEANPVYGRVYCPELFASNIAATTGALAQLPLQLGDEVRYDVVGGDIVLQQVVRVCGAAAAVVGGAVLPVQPIQKETTPSCQELLDIGFEDAASWDLDKSGAILHRGDDPGIWGKMIADYPQALYAFCVDGEVKYIGKTISTLKVRFQGYRAPGKTTVTNARCNGEIKKALAANLRVRILVLPNRLPFQWGRFRINMAAGLEDVLIDELQPDWNA
jgi:hypothetical protein